MGRSVIRSLAVGALAAISAPGGAGPTAQFDFVEYRALDQQDSDGAESFANPVLPGFHPDPSITRVGEDFYLVTSTFSYFPGLPVFHSRDLVNWRLLGHAIDRPDQADFTGLGTNRGLFAPAITHHEGRFWILNTCIECGGNFVMTADRAEGPWSDPHHLAFDGIDPSLFFDEDGSAWIVYNDAPAGEPRYEGHRALWLQQFDADALALVGEPILLVDGGVDPATHPVWAEGPHIYRVGEFYYLLAAEGGTADQHSQTIYRSAAVDGPYVPGPVNPILTQRNLPQDRPDRVEATGHADLVRLDDGSWWGVFLATRPFAGQSTLLGRETLLLPVQWTDGWPLFLAPGDAVPRVLARPNLAASPATDWGHWRDDFDGARLDPEWIGLRTPGMIQQMGLDRTAGQLWLTAGEKSAGSLFRPSFTGRRLRHHAAEVSTRIAFAPLTEGDFAGLLGFMDETHFLALGIEGAADHRAIVARMRTNARQDERGEIIARTAIAADGPVDLTLRLDGGEAALGWRMAGTDRWIPLATSVDVEPLASVHAGLFTGFVIGPYALAGQD